MEWNEVGGAMYTRTVGEAPASRPFDGYDIADHRNDGVHIHTPPRQSTATTPTRPNIAPTTSFHS